MPYTRLAEPLLERRINDDLDFLKGEIRRIVPAERLSAIVLGGGYGRGDGGMRIRDARPAPYNDYDLLVVLRRASPWLRRKIRRRVGNRRPRWEAALDLEVEVAVCTEAALRHSPRTLRLFDLAAGHQVLWGDESIREVIEPHGSKPLPLVEGARLLVNRGSLLAYCKGRGVLSAELGPAERNRRLRYLYKAVLACGDAVLMHGGQYATDSDLRVQRLCTASGPSPTVLAELRAWYAYAVDSRRVGRETLPPGCSSLDEFFERVWTAYEQVHRWFEEERLNVKPLQWTDYIGGHLEKFPLPSWPACLVERLRSLRRLCGLSRANAALRYGRENALAGWLAELLYLRGQPAVATLHRWPSQNWNEQFREYWTMWQTGA